MTTPLKRALKTTSRLREAVRKGLDALERSHKQLIDAPIRTAFADSLEIDEGLKEGNEQASRWDYLLGHEESSLVVGVEPHSAYTGEVSAVIAKKHAAREQLRRHLKSGSSVTAWFWIASGGVDFAPHDKVIRRLEQEGITFVGGVLRAKDLLKVQPSKGGRR